MSKYSGIHTIRVCPCCTGLLNRTLFYQKQTDQYRCYTCGFTFKIQEVSWSLDFQGATLLSVRHKFPTAKSFNLLMRHMCQLSPNGLSDAAQITLQDVQKALTMQSVRYIRACGTKTAEDIVRTMHTLGYPLAP